MSDHPGSGPSGDNLIVGLSIVIPVYNEVDSLDELYRRVSQSCRALDRGHEILFIDDGSTDGSAQRLDELAAADPAVQVIHFRRNFGKSPALAAAFERVRGDIVLTLDADLQDDPDLIPDFVAAIDAGADVVSGWKKRRHDPHGKTLPSKLFNAVVRRLTKIPLDDFNCGFKAYAIECVRELNVYGGFHRFMPVLAHAKGFRIEQLVVEHHPRKHGVSKYGATRFFDGLMDLMTVMLVTRYRTSPLHFFGGPSLVIGGLGFAVLMYLTVLWFLGEPIGTRPLLLMGVLLALTAMIFLCIGLLGELLVRTTISTNEVYSVARPRPKRPWSPPDDTTLRSTTSKQHDAASLGPRTPPPQPPSSAPQ